MHDTLGAHTAMVSCDFRTPKHHLHPTAQHQNVGITFLQYLQFLGCYAVVTEIVNIENIDNGRESLKNAL